MKAACVIFDRMTALDFVGFYDAVTRLKSMKLVPDFEWRICANKREVADRRGLTIVADSVAEPLQGSRSLRALDRNDTDDVSLPDRTRPAWEV
ncbi:MAG: hypothetical protein A3G24_18245 [Betaproteobacteria bacterium RIFCSPLOWO2_12_FULL_62_13]|nr:MAG: hypothetical protein A3G24_18245 [Betaproteobacteria bacterium RIFCSPLOWO2_12_FULL_62_13]